MNDSKTVVGSDIAKRVFQGNRIYSLGARPRRAAR